MRRLEGHKFVMVLGHTTADEVFFQLLPSSLQLHQLSSQSMYEMKVHNILNPMSVNHKSTINYKSTFTFCNS